jgi:hypothetical protein
MGAAGESILRAMSVMAGPTPCLAAMVFLEMDGATMANPRREPDADEERG